LNKNYKMDDHLQYYQNSNENREVLNKNPNKTQLLNFSNNNKKIDDDSTGSEIY